MIIHVHDLYMPRLSSFGDFGLTRFDDAFDFAPSSDVLQEACHLEHSRRDCQVGVLCFLS